jgi:hypothetical protein
MLLKITEQEKTPKMWLAWVNKLPCQKLTRQYINISVDPPDGQSSR